MGASKTSHREIVNAIYEVQLESCDIVDDRSGRRKVTSIVPREEIRKSIKSGKVMINLV